MGEWDATCSQRSREGPETRAVIAFPMARPWVSRCGDTEPFPLSQPLSPRNREDCTWPGGSWAPAPLCLCVLGEVGLCPAQIQLRTLVPFLRPSPCLALGDWPQPAPSPWLPLLGYRWEAGHRAYLANLYTEGEGRGRSQGPWGRRLFPACQEPRDGQGPTQGSPWGSAGHRVPPSPSL